MMETWSTELTFKEPSEVMDWIEEKVDDLLSRFAEAAEDADEPLPTRAEVLGGKQDGRTSGGRIKWKKLEKG
ncbi:hypothetical protein JCM10213v2_008819 [Rhodosporidiobolus nylandii]